MLINEYLDIILQIVVDNFVTKTLTNCLFVEFRDIPITIANFRCLPTNRFSQSN